MPVLACRWSSGQSSRTGPELRPASSSQHATRPIAASREKVAHVSQPASRRSTMLTFGGTVEHHFDNKNRTGQSTRQRLSSSSWPPCNHKPSAQHRTLKPWSTWGRQALFHEAGLLNFQDLWGARGTSCSDFELKLPKAASKMSSTLGNRLISPPKKHSGKQLQANRGAVDRWWKWAPHRMRFKRLCAHLVYHTRSLQHGRMCRVPNPNTKTSAV